MILSTLFILLAAASYGIMSRIHHGNLLWSKNEYDFWGNNSGRRKYKFPYQPPLDNWYYKLFRLSYREKFPLSATVLVSITDGFHQIQFWMIKFLILAIVFYNPLFSFWWDTGILLAAWALAFNTLYIITKKQLLIK